MFNAHLFRIERTIIFMTNFDKGRKTGNGIPAKFCQQQDWMPAVKHSPPFHSPLARIANSNYF